MKKRSIPWLRFLVFLITVSLILSTNLHSQKIAYAKEMETLSDTLEFLGRLNKSLSRVAESVKPSVVNISTTRVITLKDHPFREFFDDPFFRRFFGDRFFPFGPEREFRSSALGSGVIVSRDGYIITNNHVVKDATEIKVILYDKSEYNGKVIGIDPKTDLAVIKIKARDLPAIKIGDSQSLKVGEVVMAIGNPFGLSYTITMGIVSAVGRSNVGIAEYEDFIQTDAAINPGNSGGPLVNIRGELVGINTAIFSRTGGYMGIGFAIPSDMAKSVMRSIIKHGKVIRGWLGITIQNLTSELAKHFEIEEKKGALVTDIVKDGPADKAGLRQGDIIVKYNGKSVEDSKDLRNMVARTTPGETVQVWVVRKGKERRLTVRLGEFPEEIMAQAGKRNVMRGVNVQELTPELRQRLNIPKKVKGVLITHIDEESPARTLLRKNDVILEINRKRIKSLKDYEKEASKIGADESVLLLVFRKGGHIYVSI